MRTSACRYGDDIECAYGCGVRGLRCLVTPHQRTCAKLARHYTTAEVGPAPVVRKRARTMPWTVTSSLSPVLRADWPDRQYIQRDILRMMVIDQQSVDATATYISGVSAAAGTFSHTFADRYKYVTLEHTFDSLKTLIERVVSDYTSTVHERATTSAPRERFSQPPTACVNVQTNKEMVGIGRLA